MVNLNINILGKKEYENSDYNLAISLIKHEITNGVKKIIIATKRDGNDNVTSEEISTRIQMLCSKLYENDIKIKLYQADSIKICRNNIKECLSGKLMCINNSRYMLVDLDGTMTEEQLDMIYELTLVGIVPVIEHPERCKEIIENISNLKYLKEFGCLFQLDINSLVGNYGKKIKLISHRLLKEKEYDFVGSEVSESLSRQSRYNYSQLLQSEKDKFYRNGLKVIMNEEIKKYTQIKNRKKKLFGFMI